MVWPSLENHFICLVYSSIQKGPVQFYSCVITICSQSTICFNFPPGYRARRTLLIFSSDLYQKWLWSPIILDQNVVCHLMTPFFFFNFSPTRCHWVRKPAPYTYIDFISGGPEMLRRHLNFRQISNRFTSSFTNPSFQDLNGSHIMY